MRRDNSEIEELRQQSLVMKRFLERLNIQVAALGPEDKRAYEVALRKLNKHILARGMPALLALHALSIASIQGAASKQYNTAMLRHSEVPGGVN